MMYFYVAQGPIEDGWASWFGDSQTVNPKSLGDAGLGQSLHITAASEASFDIQFQGAQS